MMRNMPSAILALVFLILLASSEAGCTPHETHSTTGQSSSPFLTLREANRIEVQLPGTEPSSLSESDVNDVIGALVPENMELCPHNTKLAILANVIFFRGEEMLGAVSYCPESICIRSDTCVKLNRDPIKFICVRLESN